MEIDLPPFQTMKCRSRKGVMIIVPPIAEDGDREERIVTAVVVTAVGPGSNNVAEGVHAPHRMVTQGDANQTSPKKAIDGATPSSDQPITEQRGQRQSQEHPEKIEPVQLHQHSVFNQIRHVVNPIVNLGLKEPSHVRMPQSAEGVEDPRPVQKRRVRIALVIAEIVVTTMSGGPLHNRPLGGHRSENREEPPEPLRRLKRTVGEIPVKAKASADVAGPVHAQKEQDFDASHRGAGKQNDPDQKSDKRDDHHPKSNPSLHALGFLTSASCCLRIVGSVVQSFSNLIFQNASEMRGTPQSELPRGDWQFQS